MKALVVILAFFITASSLGADVLKGQRFYIKKLKSVCGINGAEMAEKHTTSEWEDLDDRGKIADEIKKICPNVDESSLKQEYIPHYFDFFKEYSSDSGNIPSC